MMTAVPGRMASATVSVILVDTPGGNAEMRLRAAFDAAGGMGPPEILVVEEADPEALARARNKGADRAVGDILAFLAPGAAPEPGWLEAVVAATAPNNYVLRKLERLFPGILSFFPAFLIRLLLRQSCRARPRTFVRPP